MPIDPGFATELARELPPADFLRVLELFRIDLARLTEEIEAAAAGGRHEEVRRAAHGMAGAAGAVGAATLEATTRVVMRQPDAGMDLVAIAHNIRTLADDTLLNIDRVIAQARSA